MTATREVSVVMAVHNGGQALARTLDSILSQTGVDFEVIVVNDGSVDDTATVLERCASRNSGVVAVHLPENAGLTQALIRGCSLARGRFIARHDAGDISLPGRFAKQFEALESDPTAAFASCGTRFVGPAGEWLYDIVQEEPEMAQALRASEPGRLRGPAHHGSTMFSRQVYEEVGGYRPQFYFAQDLDLWVRLAERGRHRVLTDVLYEATLTPRCVSGTHRREQVLLTKYVAECARLRRSGKPEADCLAKASQVRPAPTGWLARRRQADHLYFIGACLTRRGDLRALHYYRQAVRTFPLHAKSWLRLLSSGAT
jgi:glycosyltransferase involved in cell wall biosynthesis